MYYIHGGRGGETLSYKTHVNPIIKMQQRSLRKMVMATWNPTKLREMSLL